MTESEHLRLLIQRRTLLSELLDGVTDKRRLTDALDVSRPTIDRALRDLEAAGLLQSTGSSYRPTLYGRILYDHLDAFLDRFDTTTEAAALLAALPAEAPFDPVVLRDAEIDVGTQPAPHRPVHRLTALFDSAADLECLAPVVPPGFFDPLLDRIAADDVDASLYFDADTLEYLQGLDAVSDADGVRAACNAVTDSPPYLLAIADRERLWLGVYDDDTLQGSIATTCSDAVSWALSLLDRYAAPPTRTAEVP